MKKLQKKIYIMLEKRENEKLEFKKSTSELKQAIISLSSMLNKNNYGLLYFGVNNEGEIVDNKSEKIRPKIFLYK